MNNYPLFRVSSWNNGMRCVSLYVLMYVGLACFESPSQTYRLHRSSTASTWKTYIRIWTTCLFVDVNTTSLPDAVSCQHGMLPMIGNLRCCKNIHWGNKGLCHSSMSVDRMTLSPTKLNLIWTTIVISRVMTGEYPNTKLKYCQCTSAALLCY